MTAETDPAPDRGFAPLPMGSSIPPFRSIAFDLAFSAVLIALIVAIAVAIVPLITGTQRSADAALISALLPVGTLLLLCLAERLVPPAGPRKSLSNWLLHLQLNLFYFAMAGIVGTLALTGLNGLARRWGIELGFINLDLSDGGDLVVVIAVIWLAAVCGDFFFYWFHRFLHTSSFLWQHHKMHHMDLELEAITIARQNWIEVFIAAAMINIPFAIIFKTGKLSPWDLGLASGVIVTLFGIILTAGHANVRLQAGWMSKFWCTPQMHRIHHSRLPEHQDRNFAFVFPMWDVLFGTYHAPKWGEFPPTGVHGEKEIESFWEAQIFTPREWIKWLRARRREKVGSSLRVSAVGDDV